MDHATKDLVRSIKERQQQMIAQLHSLCEINSGTTNLQGLVKMHYALSEVFSSIADETQTPVLNTTLETIDMDGNVVQETCGAALFIRKRPQLKRRILLSGHMDTVYAAGDPFQSLTYLDDNRLNGPGVADMKGGLVVILHALSVFEERPIAKTLGWDLLINADEEIGSPVSSQFLESIANDYQAGLVYEPAMDQQGTLAKNRRGSGKFTLIATGRAAHVGRSFNEGRNAILYLAEAIQRINQLNGMRDGVNVNVGKIAGGKALNMVPDKAVAKLDIRLSKPEDEHWIRQQFELIINQIKRDDYSLTVEGHFGRPVKTVNAATKRLFARIQHCSQQLDIPLTWQDSGGCCDGNNLALRGLPVIDTLGVRGGNIHSPNEFILLDSFIDRSAISALLLLDLATGGLEELRS